MLIWRRRGITMRQPGEGVCADHRVLTIDFVYHTPDVQLDQKVRKLVETLIEGRYRILSSY